MVIKLKYIKLLVLIVALFACKKDKEFIILNPTISQPANSQTIQNSTANADTNDTNKNDCKYYYKYLDGYVKLKFGSDSIIYNNYPSETCGSLYMPVDSSYFNMEINFNKYGYGTNHSYLFRIYMFSKINPLISSHEIGYYYNGSWSNPEFNNNIKYIFHHLNGTSTTYYDCLGSTSTMQTNTGFTINITDMKILNDEYVLLSGEIKDKLCYGTNTYNGMTDFTGEFKNIVLLRK